jgi:3-deoxy-manno-octulosonate cytidylyltransferase (CMP-KDO synthetase)
MSAIGVIPARFASTRFPGKPLALILGKSLIQRTYENAARCKDLEEVVVATDDLRILEHVLGFGGKAVMTSEGCLTGTDRLQEVVENFPQYARHEIVVNVQGDEPCLDPEVVASLVRKLREDPAAVCATPVFKALLSDETASFVKCVKDVHDNALYFSRAFIPGNKNQGTPLDVLCHMGIYAYRKSFLKTYASLLPGPLQLAECLEQLKILEYGYKIKVVVVESLSLVGLDVNHPEDIEKIESYLCKQNSFS